MAGNPNIGSLTVSAGHTSHFTQTGSWSMLDLAKLPLQATVGVLSRYCAGRVNPYTAVVGQALCKRFQLSQYGRRNIEGAVRSLRALGTIGDTLYFGFGVEDLVRSLAATEEGLICLGLCGALAECYHEDVGVEVLLELAKSSEIPGEYMPSSLEWKALLKACAGTLATSHFPRLAESLMALWDPEGRSRTESWNRSCSDPRSLAAALIEISAVSRSQLRELAIFGGIDAGWLAAFAEWFLQLSVTIANSEGETLYIKNGRKDTLVSVVFKPPHEANLSAIQVRGKTIVLEDLSTLIHESERSMVVSGRVDWSAAFESTFPSDFRKIMETPATIGTLIGSAARIFEAVAIADPSIPKAYSMCNLSYCMGSRGRGFVHTVLHWFPELKIAADAMHYAAKHKTLADATSNYDEAIEQIRRSCECSSCKERHDSEFFPLDDADPSESSRIETHTDANLEGWASLDMEHNETMTSAPSRDEEVSDNRPIRVFGWRSEIFCLVAIAETIIRTSRLLANVDVAQDLLPTRSGLERICRSQEFKRGTGFASQDSVDALGQAIFCFERDHVQWGSLHMESNQSGQLLEVLNLFIASEYIQPLETRNRLVAAHGENGICVFLKILQEALPGEENTLSIGVINGHISFEKKKHDVLLDAKTQHLKADAALTIVTSVSSQDMDKPRLMVTERSRSLDCLLEFRAAEDTDTVVHLLGPAKLAGMLCGRRGLVSCGRDRQCKHDPVIPDTDLKNAIARRTLIRVKDKSGVFLRPQSIASFLAAVAVAANMPDQGQLYILGAECPQCCARTVLSIQAKEETHFCCLSLPSST